MPVQRGSFFGTGDVVVDCDGDDVAPVGFDCGPGKLSIDEECVFLVAIWRDGASRNRELVGSLLT